MYGCWFCGVRGGSRVGRVRYLTSVSRCGYIPAQMVKLAFYDHTGISEASRYRGGFDKFYYCAAGLRELGMA